jgi:hypothetical protein
VLRESGPAWPHHCGVGIGAAPQKIVLAAPQKIAPSAASMGFEFH